MPLSARYKAALVAVVALTPLLATAEVRVAGAVLPDGAQKVSENRYRVPRSFDETLKFYRQVYGGRYVWRAITDQPSVKAVHIENPDAKPGQWEGLNVYEVKSEARIFVLIKAPKK